MVSVTIEVDNLDGGYVAQCEGFEGQGKSPDEAVGHVIREMWLAKAYMFTEPCRIEMVYGHK